MTIPGGPLLRTARPGQRVLARLIDSVGCFVVLAAGGEALTIGLTGSTSGGRLMVCGS